MGTGNAVLDAFTLIPGLAETARRTQDRRHEPTPERADWTTFANEPDTDFSLPHNSEWIEAILRRKKSETGDAAAEVPVVIAGQKILAGRPVRENADPSRPGVVVARYRQATAQDIEGKGGRERGKGKGSVRAYEHFWLADGLPTA